jgi:hypothetical protein
MSVKKVNLTGLKASQSKRNRDWKRGFEISPRMSNKQDWVHPSPKGIRIAEGDLGSRRGAWGFTPGL